MSEVGKREETYAAMNEAIDEFNATRRMRERMTAVFDDRAAHSARTKAGIARRKERKAGMTSTAMLSSKGLALVAAWAHGREVEAGGEGVAEAMAEVQRLFPAELARELPRSKERETLLFDTMVTALEGGVGYWSVGETLVHDHENNRYLSYKLICSEGGQDAVECGMSTEEVEIPFCLGHTVVPDVIERGYGLAASAKLNSETRSSILLGLAENDGCQIDASDADVVVQLGIFGTVVYG